MYKRQSRERVRAAIKNSGYEFPLRRITVNLAPADLKKEGAGFDLPIALGVLAATGQVELTAELQQAAFTGELSLDGKIRPVKGVLPMALSLDKAGLKMCIRDRYHHWYREYHDDDEVMVCCRPLSAVWPPQFC